MNKLYFEIVMYISFICLDEINNFSYHQLLMSRVRILVKLHILFANSKMKTNKVLDVLYLFESFYIDFILHIFSHFVILVLF